MTGQVLGRRYRLLDVIGRGGMATVYRSSDTMVDREVALKVLDPSVISPSDPSPRERFLRESRVSLGLSHANIVEVLAAGESDGVCFIAMELLCGRTLAKALWEERAFPWKRTLALSRQLGAGLGFMHRQGLVHRDLKPANCFVQGTGPAERLKLLDFGLSKPVKMRVGDAEVTQPTVVLGSPTYMAPEQALGLATVETDIYAVGVLLFRMLAGRAPFFGPNASDILLQHAQAPVPWIREVAPTVEVPAAVELVVRQCLEKNPRARYPSVGALVTALDQAEATASPPLRRPGPAVATQIRSISPPSLSPVPQPTALVTRALARGCTSRWEWLAAAAAIAAIAVAATTITLGSVSRVRAVKDAEPLSERPADRAPPSMGSSAPLARRGAEELERRPSPEAPTDSALEVDLVPLARGAANILARAAPPQTPAKPSSGAGSEAEVGRGRSVSASPRSPGGSPPRRPAAERLIGYKRDPYE